MTLAPNAVMTFVDYSVDSSGAHMHFVCANPGSAMPSDYYVVVTDADMTGITTQAQLKTLVTTKLQAAYRDSTLSNRLDPFIGQSITI